MSRFGQRVRPSNSIATSAVANWFGNQFVTFNPWEPQSSLESLGVFRPNGSSGVLTVSLPTGYKDIKIISSLKGDSTAGSYPTACAFRLNGDATTTNYWEHTLRGNGSTYTAGADNGNGNFLWGAGGYPTGENVQHVASIIDIADYSSTTKKKILRNFEGYEANGSGSVRFTSMVWNSTDPVTTLTFIADPAYIGNWTSNSSFEIYGVR